MTQLSGWFEQELAIEPAGDLDAALRQAPAKWVVYLMSDADDRPVQLLCVKNLRYSLRHRLLTPPDAGPSRRVNYRELVRRVRWRRVHSAFEADWVYWEIARVVFPESYRGMIGFRPAWFIHVNPEHDFPRWIKTIDLAKGGTLIGPIEDKHAAARLIELIEDWFDLCRYYRILVEAPHGSACAYKEMGKCPAPCDGSISMEQYRAMIAWSAKVVVDPAEFIRDHQHRMQQAAAELQFETAGKIKAFVEQLGQLGKGQFRHARRLADFRYLSFQHGPKRGKAKIFLITPGGVEELAGLIAEPTRPGEIMRVALERSAECESAATVSDVDAERVGVVAHHLFSAKSTHGVFLPMEQIDEKSIVRAWRDLQKQEVIEPTESEGVVKELQSMQ
jgi:excinuclease UvrABC nuclease subunit